jgi:hypothetical protein
MARPERIRAGADAMRYSVSGQTSMTPWATAQGDFAASAIASSRSLASMMEKPAIGRSADR